MRDSRPMKFDDWTAASLEIKHKGLTPWNFKPSNNIFEEYPKIQTT